jgi:hypothetical protein
MKKLIALAALLALAFTSSAQTNSTPSFTAGVQEMANAISTTTNWTVVTGYGRGTSGNKNVVFSDVAFNFNNNVGLVVGYDDLFGTGKPQANVVKGGVTLSATIHPFSFIGSTFLTNIVGTPFVADLIASPKNTSSGIGNIVTTGYNFDVYAFKNFELTAGAQYENRTGQGAWDGNYILVHLGLSRRF